MRGGADAAVRLFHAVTVLLEIVHKFAQILGRKIIARYDDGGRLRGEADRHKITLGIVFQIRG